MSSDYAPANNPTIAETTALLNDSGQVSKKTFSYDSFNNLTDTYEYDYGAGTSGSLLRRTHTDFLTTNSVNSTDYTSDAIHLLSLPSQTWISSDSSGSTKVALSQIEYDNYASSSTHAGLEPRASVSGFDSTNFGTGFTFRGNVTAVTSYANAGTPSDGVNRYSQYDVLGNIVKTIDANINVTTITYTDNFGAANSDATTPSTITQLSGLSTFAFPTSTTNPMSWTSHIQYDYYTGAAVNAQDLNGLIAKSIYNDDLDRQTQTVSAIGTANEIQTTIDYDDANRTVITTGDLFTLNDNLRKGEALYDGLGRTVEQRSYTEGDFVSVKTEYDALGRLFRTSNPFRPTRSETPVWTEHTYDALGRAIEIETSDGATVTTAYNGNRTLMTDQAGKQSISKVNALGQLKDVWEITAADSSTESVSFPNQSISAAYRTSYTYDGANNLTEVSQGAQTRTFTYDNLSRLLSAANPESGTISYTYDANGNLKTKRDALNIKTVHDFDALNRVTKRCYRSIGTGSLGMTTCASNTETQEPNTSDVTYTHENTSITSLKNVLTKVANGISETEYLGFDATGRVTRTRQTTDGAVYGDDTNPMTYSYSLSGALLEQKYPSGRVVRNVFDQDGRLEVLQSKKNASSGFWTYANSFSYNSAGAATSMQLGNGRWESTTFNSREQPTQIALGVTPGATNLLDLDYSYGTTSNNGNVLSQTITVAGVGVTNGFAAAQIYNYDSLNRLKDATESLTPTGGSSSQSWKQVFTYDRYGNRNFVTGSGETTTLGSCPSAVCNPAISPNDNKLTSTGYTFDAAGNSVRDAKDRKYTYDGENKQVKVESLSPGTNTVTGIVGEYHYDGDGNRVKKYVPATGEITIFVYDAVGKLVGEYSPMVAATNEAKVACLTSDHLGSPRINTDANGMVTARHDYHPFGDEITANRASGLAYGDDMVRKQFTGYERDNEIELDFAQARYYNSVHGRFTTVDPLSVSALQSDPQTFNRYVYVRNSPLVMTDPTGMMGDYFSYNGNYLGHDGKDDRKVYFATLIEDRGKEVDLDRRTIRRTTLAEVLKAQDRAVAITPGTSDSIGELVDSVAKNAETKGRTVRMVATAGAVGGVCVGTAGAGCAGAVRLGTAIIQSEVEAAETAAADTVSTSVHGNSLSSPKPTWDYGLWEKDGEFLKNGITSEEKPENRYTKEYMKDKEMRDTKLHPNRRAARDVERHKNTVNPGPLNKRR